MTRVLIRRLNKQIISTQLAFFLISAFVSGCFQGTSSLGDQDQGSTNLGYVGAERNSPAAQKAADRVEAILKDAGVCKLPPYSGVSGLSIQSADAVLTQFICIANNESTHW